MTSNQIIGFTQENGMDVNVHGDTVEACTSVAVDSPTGRKAGDKIPLVNKGDHTVGPGADWCQVQVKYDGDTNSTGQCYVMEAC